MTPIFKMSNAGGMGATLNRYSDMLAGNASYNPPSYYSIATINPAGSTTVSFTSIPQGYSHLQIRAVANSVRTAASYDTPWIQFNGSSTAGTYSDHSIYGDSRPYLTGSADTGLGLIYLGQVPTAYTGLGSSWVGTHIIDIYDYTNTNKNKTIKFAGSYDTNSIGTSSITGSNAFGSGAWYSTAAINRIDIIMGNNFNTNTTFALYGVK